MPTLPLILTIPKDTESEEYKLCSHAHTLSKNNTKDKRKACKAEKSRAWNEVAEPRINLLPYNFTNFCL